VATAIASGEKALGVNAAKAAASAAARILELEGMVKTLEAKVEVKAAQLVALEASKVMAVQHAEMVGVQSASRELVQRYKDGLKDGASLSHGNGVVSPDTIFQTPK